MNISSTSPAWITNDTSWQHKGSMFDCLTTFGVRLFNPMTRTWVEVSVLGNCYQLREGQFSTSENQPVAAPAVAATNELLDGSIIDISGVLFLFNKKSTVIPFHQTAAMSQYISRVQLLNAQHPQCK